MPRPSRPPEANELGQSGTKDSGRKPQGKPCKGSKSPVFIGSEEPQGPLAQRLEPWTHNPLVVGSNPTGPSVRSPCFCRGFPFPARGYVIAALRRLCCAMWRDVALCGACALARARRFFVAVKNGVGSSRRFRWLSSCHGSCSLATAPAGRPARPAGPVRSDVNSGPSSA